MAGWRRGDLRLTGRLFGHGIWARWTRRTARDDCSPGVKPATGPAAIAFRHRLGEPRARTPGINNTSLVAESFLSSTLPLLLLLLLFSFFSSFIFHFQEPACE